MIMLTPPAIIAPAIDEPDSSEPGKSVHAKAEYVWRVYQTTEEYAMHNNLSPQDLTRICYFDMDNTLYPASSGVSLEMRDRIKLYLQQKLGIPDEEAESVGNRFYTDYGLAIKGCVKHLGVDPREYDLFVDGGLRLEELLLVGLQGDHLESLEGMRARRWVFTNAGGVHARRVLDILGITHLFEGVVYCDYTEPDFPAKPDISAYQRAMECAGFTASSTPPQVYFVDDSSRNVEAGRVCGWRSVCLDELGEHGLTGCPVIRSLTELPSVFPELYHKL